MSSDNDTDYSEIQSALESIGLSAALIFGATLLSQGLGFVTRVTMARYLPVDGYGNVVIGLSFLNLFGIAALAGMPDALSRYLPRQETDNERRTILSSAFQIVLVLSTTLGIVSYLAAEPVATLLFKNADLTWIIRIFAGVLPFYAILRMSIGGFRGYETTYPRILTQNVLRPSFQLAGIVLFVTIGYGTTGIAFAYASAFGIVSIIGIALLYRVSEFSARDVTSHVSTSQYRELLTFSIPLAASGAIGVIAKHSDLILLGIFKSSTTVGIYEVSFRTAMFVTTIFLPAIGYLFQPIISRFHSHNKLGEMDDLYTVSTRWIVVGSFPIFALFFLFPEKTLRFFFGPSYGEGQLALQVLLIGFMISLLPGLTGSVLTAVGKTRLMLYISVVTVVLNVVINIALIPVFGIVGAAVATAIARIMNNTLQLYYIHRDLNIHPFDQTYISPSVLMLAIFVLITIAPLSLDTLSFFEGSIVASGLGLLYLACIFATRSILPIELELIDGFLDLLGIPVSFSSNLQRFVQKKNN